MFRIVKNDRWVWIYIGDVLLAEMPLGEWSFALANLKVIADKAA